MWPSAAWERLQEMEREAGSGLSWRLSLQCVACSSNQLIHTVPQALWKEL